MTILSKLLVSLVLGIQMLLYTGIVKVGRACNLWNFSRARIFYNNLRNFLSHGSGSDTTDMLLISCSVIYCPLNSQNSPHKLCLVLFVINSL